MLAFPSDESGSVCMDHVLGSGYPFEIGGPIVQLVSVDVVDLGLTWRLKTEGLGHKSMDEPTANTVGYRWANPVVPATPQTQAKEAPAAPYSSARRNFVHSVKLSDWEPCLHVEECK